MPTDAESVRINRLFEQKKWAEARRFIERELGRVPADDWIRHWWLTRLSTTYYEERDYDKALGIAWRAHTIAPDCPLVLWDLAGTLEMQGDPHGAAKHYRKLLAQGAHAIAEDQCGEGLEWANSLLTDCSFRLACCYESLGRMEDASRRAVKTLSRLERKLEGIHSIEDVTKLLNRVRLPASV